MVHCFQKIWFNERMHPNDHRNGHHLSTKWAEAATNICQVVALCSQSRSCLQQGGVPEGAVH